MGIERTVGPQFVPITMPTASTVDHRSCRERGTRHPRRSPSPASPAPRWARGHSTDRDRPQTAYSYSGQSSPRRYEARNLVSACQVRKSSFG